MVATGATTPQLSRLFYEAGPQQVLDETRALLDRACAAGQLAIDDRTRAAEHFCSLIKGINHFHQLIGYAPPLDDAAMQAHVADVVALFVRAYAPG